MKKLLAVLLVGICASGAAWAEGQYAVLDVGMSQYGDACKGVPTGWSCTNTSAVGRVAVGTFFRHSYFAGELSYADFGTAHQSGVGAGGVAQNRDFSSSAVQLSAIGKYPLKYVLLTGKLGLVRSFTSGSNAFATTSATRTSLGYGIGMEIYLGMDDPIGLRLQYEDLGTFGNAATTGTSRVRFVSAGIFAFF